MGGAATQAWVNHRAGQENRSGLFSSYGCRDFAALSKDKAWKASQEATMARLFPLFARFGLFASKSFAEPDAFELRLMRIGTREARLPALGLTFRNRS